MAAPMIEVTTTGPIFDPDVVGQAFRDGMTAATDIVADRAVTVVGEYVSYAAKHPTGSYADQVIGNRATYYSVRVHDQESPYGPWLEGESLRNYSTGYAGIKAWRRTRTEIDSDPGLWDAAQDAFDAALAARGLR
jgi:hypothetical protein